MTDIKRGKEIDLALAHLIVFCFGRYQTDARAKYKSGNDPHYALLFCCRLLLKEEFQVGSYGWNNEETNVKRTMLDLFSGCESFHFRNGSGNHWRFVLIMLYHMRVRRCIFGSLLFHSCLTKLFCHLVFYQSTSLVMSNAASQALANGFFSSARALPIAVWRAELVKGSTCL